MPTRVPITYAGRDGARHETTGVIVGGWAARWWPDGTGTVMHCATGAAIRLSGSMPFDCAVAVATELQRAFPGWGADAAWATQPVGGAPQDDIGRAALVARRQWGRQKARTA